ncbi:hypothetical protein DL765_005501 [Monosporascus sp. GIB2]|nr:hypothetical protein DL765_005501 [Monosporascus sp. GIB2]
MSSNFVPPSAQDGIPLKIASIISYSVLLKARISLKDDPPPAARTIATYTVDENDVQQRRDHLMTMIPSPTPTGTVPPEELPQPTMYNLNSSDTDRGEPPPGSAERCFSVDGHGLTAVRQLSGFPGEDEPLTFNSLRAFDRDNATTFSPDFSFWPDHDGPFEHMAGAITCSEEIYLRIALNRSYGDGSIYLDQDEKNGFYIQSSGAHSFGVTGIMI